MAINKLIISMEEARKHFSRGLISLFLDTSKPITKFFGIEIFVTSEDLKNVGIAFESPVKNIEINEVLGLKIEQIAWMKAYFVEHCLPFTPSKEFINQKLRECLSKQED